MASHVEFFQQLLHARNLVGFFIDLDMRQHQSRIDGEGAENLFCLGIVEIVEAALERFTIECNDTGVGNRRVEIQVGGVCAKDFFDLRRTQPLQNISDASIRGRLFPFEFEGFVQPLPMRHEERPDAAIRVGAADDRQYGKQQQVLQLITFSFGAARVRDCREKRKESLE